jgi:Ran GTPase-activating protein (RanGAP) involved in mRNA processing and transport
VYTSAIQEVDLRGNYLGGESARLLCSALLETGESCALRRLSLRGNPLGLDGGHAIAELLRSPACTIEDLDVGDARLQVANLIAIATALRDNVRLRVLNLDNPVVQTKEEEAVQHIGKMLQVNDTLEALSLGKHQLSDHGAQVLAERLLDNRALRSLSLRANRIGADGASALAALSLRHRGLQQLDLSANRIGDAGGRAFARALAPEGGAPTASSLRVLALCSASMADEGVAAVVGACVRQRQRSPGDSDSDGVVLQGLLLWGNAFGPQSAREIAQLVQEAAREAAPPLETDVVAWQPEGEQGDVRIAQRELPAASPAANMASPKR